MGRRWIVALTLTGVFSAAIGAQAETKWSIPKPSFWPGSSKADKPAKKKSKSSSSSKSKKSKGGVEQASAWKPFDAKPMDSAKSIVKAPTNLAKRVGTETKQLYGKTKNAVVAPFRSDDDPKPSRKSTASKSKSKSKSSSESKSFLNPWGSKAKKTPEKSKEDQSLTEWLRQDRPGFE